MKVPDPEHFDFVDHMLGIYSGYIPNLMCFVNPIDNIHPDIPPVLIQHGRYDPCVPYQQATELYRRIIDVAGEGRAVLDISDVYTHADPGFADPDSIERIFAFLDAHLKKN